MRPCDDLQRYVVDNFHSRLDRSKTVLFEKIDLSTYKSSTKVTSFLTSEERLSLLDKNLYNAVLQSFKPEAYNLEAYKSVSKLGFIRARD